MADFTVRTSLMGAARNPVTGAPAREGMICPKLVAMLEIDLDGTLATSQYLTLIPVSDNPNGLIVQNVKAICTELVAAESTDPVLTVRDGATSPNTLATISCTSADAQGDHVPPTSFTAQWESLADGTNYSDQHVEAGVKVECAITTVGVSTSTLAGRVLVLVEFIQVPSNRD